LTILAYVVVRLEKSEKNYKMAGSKIILQVLFQNYQLLLYIESRESFLKVQDV